MTNAAAFLEGTVFWNRREATSPSITLDALFGMPEQEQRTVAAHLVATGAWQESDADVAFRLARRLETFVAPRLPQPALVVERDEVPLLANARPGGRRARERAARRRARAA